MKKIFVILGAVVLMLISGAIQCQAALTEDELAAKIIDAVKTGEDINVQDDRGYTALMSAAENKWSLRIIKLLIDNGADINHKAKDGYTALMVAANKGEFETVNELLKRGADVNAKDAEGFTVLMRAVVFHSKRDYKTVKLLIDNGADINHKAKNGYTALSEAVNIGENNIDVIRLLLDNGAEVNIQWKEENPYLGNTPILNAALSRYGEVIKLLTEYGADINYKSENNAFGCSAFDLVVKGNKKELIEFLIRHGGNVNDKLSTGETLLTYSSFQGDNEAVELLIDNGVPINQKDNNGITALMTAADSGKFDTVKLLIKKGADINAKSKDGKSVMAFANRCLEGWENSRKRFGITPPEDDVKACKKTIEILKKAGAKE